MIGAALDVEGEELLGQFRAKRVRRLVRRELTSEATAAATFLVATAGLVLAAPWEPDFSWPVAVGLCALYAVASRVRFEVWSCHTDATQLALVPALLLLPPAAVPLLAASGYVLGELPEYLQRRRHPERIVVAIANSWYAIGPAFVIAFSGGIHGLGDWPLLVAALAAQFATDTIINGPREWLELGASPRDQLPTALWTYGVDALLSSVGFVAGVASLHEPYAFMLMLPLVALMAIFAGERERRLDNALELSEAYRGTTLLLSELVEHDDEYTGVHSQGVVKLALQVSEELGVATRRNVEFGALLHDVGKMAVPKEIINKEGPLTEEEWEQVRLHTITGQRMLDRVGGTLSEVGRIVRWSHERWDGGGYPDGLSGEDIPIESRIISCCDAFDAMTTDRAYRRAMPVRTAARELLANAGSQFDPSVATTVARLVDSRN